MFHSATLKLTGIYLAILMTISLSFSIVVYNLSADQFERRINSPEQVLKRFPRIEASELQEVLLEQSEAAQKELRAQLFITNLVILAAGGALSYFLAVRTLEPIEKAHKAQGRFVSDASHELRTPLAIMQSEIEVALREKKLSIADAKELLHSNLEEIEKLRELSQALLDLTRANGEVELESLDLQEVIESVLNRISKRAKLKEISIYTDELKPTAIQAHPIAAREVLLIVLDNAIKYSPDGSNINITATISSRWVEVEIRDSGIGMKASELEHIFDTFYRADHSRNAGSVAGFGLGLPLAKRLIEQQGGQISVHSVPDEGSTFLLQFKRQ